jgi:hypothetical protein
VLVLVVVLGQLVRKQSRTRTTTSTITGRRGNFLLVIVIVLDPPV